MLPRVGVQNISNFNGSHQRLDFILDNIPAFISYIDRNLCDINILTRNMKKPYGINSSEIIGQRVLDILGQQEFEEVKPNFDKVLSGEKVSLKSYMTFKNLGEIYVEANFIPEINNENQVQRFFCALVYDLY